MTDRPDGDPPRPAPAPATRSPVPTSPAGPLSPTIDIADLDEDGLPKAVDPEARPWTRGIHTGD